MRRRRSPVAASRAIVVMGVAGSGKSTVGAALAERLGARFTDGDALHPPGNVAKMAAGTPLTDADRAPWLDRVGGVLARGEGPHIVACSALKRAYRDRIRAAAGRPVAFLHLTGGRDLIAARLRNRKDHFMPPGLLDSQFATLEPLAPEETGLALAVDRPVGAIVAALARALSE